MLWGNLQPVYCVLAEEFFLFVVPRTAVDDKTRIMTVLGLVRSCVTRGILSEGMILLGDFASVEPNSYMRREYRYTNYFQLFLTID